MGVKSDMSRRHLPLIAAVTFVAALALFAMSFLGHWHLYSNGGFRLEGTWSVALMDGRVAASRSHLVSSYISMPSRPSWRNGGGFSFERRLFVNGGPVGGMVMSEHLAIPLYPLPLLSGLLLGWCIVRGRRMPPPGHCVICGYDLRATPDRCPECGTAVVHGKTTP